MPIYVYRDQVTQQEFEIIQRLADPVLLVHPETGNPVSRVITAPSLNLKASQLSNENIARNGFTKYAKSGNGSYEKVAGTGPRAIRANGGHTCSGSCGCSH